MKAMVITKFGGPEVFESRELPMPELGPNQVLVRVEVTSINPVDYKIRQAGAWAGVQPPAVIGYDVSGVVVDVGPGVLNFVVGDPVYYTPEIFVGSGSYAEYHVADESIVSHKPENMSYTEAASIPLAGSTAWDALVTRGRVGVGETVLIHGLGGVGSLALQIARAAGAQSLVVCSDYARELARELGAARAIDYKSEDWQAVVGEETDGAGVDLVLDTVGGETLAQSIQVTKSFGRMVGIVSAKGDFDPAFRKNITQHFFFLERLRYKLDNLRALIQRGQLRAVIDSVLPLKEVGQAHRRLEEGGVRGKSVLKVVQD